MCCCNFLQLILRKYMSFWSRQRKPDSAPLTDSERIKQNTLDVLAEIKRLSPAVGTFRSWHGTCEALIELLNKLADDKSDLSPAEMTSLMNEITPFFGRALQTAKNQDQLHQQLHPGSVTFKQLRASGGQALRRCQPTQRGYNKPKRRK